MPVEVTARSDPAGESEEAGHQGLVGQEEARRLFARATAAARRERRTVPHCLIDGPAGTGNTTFARAIAAGMGTEARIANAPLIRDAVALITILLSAACGSVIFIDEMQRPADPAHGAALRSD